MKIRYALIFVPIADQEERIAMGMRKRREEDEEEADAVDPEMVLDAEAEPCRLLDELRPGRRGVEPEIQDERDEERRNGAGKGQAVEKAFAVPGQEEAGPARRRGAGT